MVAVIINPGTEGRIDATLSNAEKIADIIRAHFGLHPGSVQRAAQYDSAGGFFGFILTPPGRDPVELSIPGDEVGEFCLSKPFTSRRMYVDGSSWLYGYALSAIDKRINGEQGESST